MAVKYNEPVRLCAILTNGPVAILGGISGPITKCKLTSSQIIAIMRGGHRVAEYNPDKSGKWTELTLDNNGASPFNVAPQMPEKTSPSKVKKETPAPVVPKEETSEPEQADDLTTEETPVVEDTTEETPVAPTEEPAVDAGADETVEDVPAAEEIPVVEETSEPEKSEDPVVEETPETEETSDTASVEKAKKNFTIDVESTSAKGTGSKKTKKSSASTKK